MSLLLFGTLISRSVRRPYSLEPTSIMKDICLTPLKVQAMRETGFLLSACTIYSIMSSVAAQARVKLSTGYALMIVKQSKVEYVMGPFSSTNIPSCYLAACNGLTDPARGCFWLQILVIGVPGWLSTLIFKTLGNKYTACYVLRYVLRTNVRISRHLDCLSQAVSSYRAPTSLTSQTFLTPAASWS